LRDTSSFVLRQRCVKASVVHLRPPRHFPRSGVGVGELLARELAVPMVVRALGFAPLSALIGGGGWRGWQDGELAAALISSGIA
jgi:hypothetical protein